MSTNCEHCGRIHLKEDNFCAACGRPLKEPSSSPQLAESKYEQALERLEARLDNRPTKQIEFRWLYTFGLSTLILGMGQIIAGFFEDRLIYLLPMRFIFEILFFSITLLPLIVCFALPSSNRRNVLLGGSVLLALLSFYYNFL